jgi:hypothetical protein
MTRFAVSNPIQLTCGRRSERLHHYPACGGHGLRKTRPVFRTALNANSHFGSLPGSAELIGLLGLVKVVSSGGLHYGALDHHPCGRIFPQGDEKFAGERNDCWLLEAAAIVLNSVLKPTRERGAGLITDPQP